LGLFDSETLKFKANDLKRNFNWIDCDFHVMCNIRCYQEFYL